MSMERKQNQSDNVKVISMPTRFMDGLLNLTQDLHPNGKLLSDSQIQALFKANLSAKFDLKRDSGIKLSKRHSALKDTSIQNKYSLIIYQDKNDKPQYWLRFGSQEKHNLIGSGGNKKQKLIQNLETGEWRKVASSKVDSLKDEWTYSALLDRTDMNVIHYTTQSKPVKATVDQKDQEEKAIMTEGGEDKFYLISQFIPGENLHTIAWDYYYENNFMSLSEWQNILIQLLESVQELHEKNLIHGDIKSANFIFDWVTQRLKIIDFDSTLKLISNDIDTVFSTFDLTTPCYRAPEIMLIKDGYYVYSKQSDIYACGLVLDEMLGRFWLYEEKQWRENPLLGLRDKPEMKPWLEEIEKMKSTDPAKRPSLKSVITKLKPLCQPLPEKKLKCLQLSEAVKYLEKKPIDREVHLYKPNVNCKVIFVDTQKVEVSVKQIICLRQKLEDHQIAVADFLLKASTLQEAEKFLTPNSLSSTALIFKSNLSSETKSTSRETKDVKDSKEDKEQKNKIILQNRFVTLYGCLTEVFDLPRYFKSYFAEFKDFPLIDTVKKKINYQLDELRHSKTTNDSAEKIYNQLQTEVNAILSINFLSKKEWHVLELFHKNLPKTENYLLFIDACDALFLGKKYDKLIRNLCDLTYSEIQKIPSRMTRSLSERYLFLSDQYKQLCSILPAKSSVKIHHLPPAMKK